MPKGNPRSSASSATRKKHAKKSAPGSNTDVPLPIHKPKKDKNAPKIKSYVPPVKPGPIVHDPLDALGLARVLPAELVVCLRMLGKKSSVTREKGLEELKSRWLDHESELIAMSPVWLHHLPSLLTHPQRRIRLSAATIHGQLLSSSESLRESLWTDKIHVLGTWILSLYDVDRAVAQVPHSSILVTEEVLTFLARTILDPDAMWVEINPVDSGNDEESPSDRNTRLRISALGALKEALTQIPQHEVLDDPLLYTTIYASTSPPWLPGDSKSLGFGQPTLRKAAWNFMGVLTSLKNLPNESLIAAALLCSAFIEDDFGIQNTLWPILLQWLKAHPNSWQLANSYLDANDNPSTRPYPLFLSYISQGCNSCPRIGYPIITLLLQIGGLTTEVMVANTTTEDSPLSHFLSSMWLGASSPTLTAGLSAIRGKAQQAFISSFGECLIFLLGRTVRQNDLSLINPSSPIYIVREQVAKLLEYVLSIGLTANVGKQVLSTLRRFFVQLNNLDADLFQASFSVVQQTLMTQVPSASNAVVRCLVAFCCEKDDLVSTLSRDILGTITTNVLTELQTVSDETPENQQIPSWDVLGKLIIGFNGGSGSLWEVLPSTEVKQTLDEVVLRQRYTIVQTHTTIFEAFLTNHPDLSIRQDLWNRTLENALEQEDVGALEGMIDLVEKNYRVVPVGDGGEIRVGSSRPVWRKMFSEVLQHDKHTESREFMLFRKVLRADIREHFLSREQFLHLLENIEVAFVSRMDDLLRVHAVPNTSVHSLDFSGTGPLENLIEFIAVVVGDSGAKSSMLKVPETFIKRVAPGIYILSSPYAKIDTAKKIWDAFDLSLLPQLWMVVGEWLKTALSTLQTVLSPEIIYEITHSQPPIQSIIVPSNFELNAIFSDVPLNIVHPSLGVLDPLVPPLSNSPTTSSTLVSFDSHGLSLYPRLIVYLILTFYNDRMLAKQHPWIIRHLLAFEVVADTWLSLSGGGGGGSSANASSDSEEWVFDKLVGRNKIEDYVMLARSIVLYLVRGCVGVAGVVGDCLKGTATGKTPSAIPTDNMRNVLVGIFSQARASDQYGDCRMFRRVMELVLDGDLEDEESERRGREWFELGRSVEKQSPNLSITILRTITQHQSISEPLKLSRYRTELATYLPSIPPSKSLSIGLLTLRRLNAVAPKDDSDIVFMTEQRAVNVVVVLQKWIGGMHEDDDDDDDEEEEGVGEEGELECAMTMLLKSLVPILQGVVGSHWEFIWDLVEANLESVNLEDGTSLTTFSHTLELVQVLQDVVSTNRRLREEYWKEKSTVLFSIIRDVAVRWNDTAATLPHEKCLRLVLSILQNLPGTLVQKDTLSKMCHHLHSPSLAIRNLIYPLLRSAAQRYTEDLVVEVSVQIGISNDDDGGGADGQEEGEREVKIELPEELLSGLVQDFRDFDIISGGGVSHEDLDMDVDGEEEGEEEVLGWLLGWMIVFDAFDHGSLKVRMGYIDQLRTLGLVEKWFLPNLWHFMRLDSGVRGGLGKTFKLDVWGVDEFYVQLLDETSDRRICIPILAAHLYFRALQTIRSLIHSWVMECKDRQLSSTITAYTSTYFSPLLITAEFEHLKSPLVLADLTSTTNEDSPNSFSVKVIPTTNEVVAGYLLGDEDQKLEVKMKVPSDWPLHRIEVSGEKRVGVEENRWRAWVFGLCQVVWSQNGRIADGLSLWKKNVNGHFEGQVECAICYSIISAMDGQLPKKPCKTCKNRFHASCLFKWFTTSHSSSCPLCRSDSF